MEGGGAMQILNCCVAGMNVLNKLCAARPVSLLQCSELKLRGVCKGRTMTQTRSRH